MLFLLTMTKSGSGITPANDASDKEKKTFTGIHATGFRFAQGAVLSWVVGLMLDISQGLRFWGQSCCVVSMNWSCNWASLSGWAISWPDLELKLIFLRGARNQIDLISVSGILTDRYLSCFMITQSDQINVSAQARYFRICWTLAPDSIFHAQEIAGPLEKPCHASGDIQTLSSNLCPWCKTIDRQNELVDKPYYPDRWSKYKNLWQKFIVIYV